VTITTVGYGDILPDTPAEKKFVVFVRPLKLKTETEKFRA
jgi:hypothetical protein